MVATSLRMLLPRLSQLTNQRRSVEWDETIAEESQIQKCPYMYMYMYMSKAIALSKTPGVIVDLIDQVILHETCGCL